MTKMKDSNNIGQFVKEKLKDYREKPNDQVWQNLEKNISASGSTATSNIGWWTGAIGVIAVSAVLYFSVLKENPADQTKTPQQDNKEQVSEFVNDTGKSSPAMDKKTKQIPQKPVKPSLKSKSSTEPQRDISVDNKPELTVNDTKSNTNQISTIKSRKTEEVKVDNQPDQTESIALERADKLSLRESRQNQDISLQEDIQHNKPVSKVVFSEDVEVCTDEKATLWASGGKSYSWSTGSEDSIIHVRPKQTQHYSVTVINDADERITHEFTVKVKECGMLYMPNAFTPNSDGYNDIFKAYGVAIESFRMQIMNKQGVIVFESASLTDGWDGNYTNRPAPAGVYLYRVVYTGIEGETKTKTGTLTLIR